MAVVIYLQLDIDYLFLRRSTSSQPTDRCDLLSSSWSRACLYNYQRFPRVPALKLAHPWVVTYPWNRIYVGLLLAGDMSIVGPCQGMA